MLILDPNTESKAEKKLVLGDYMTVHVVENQKPVGIAAVTGIQTKHEAFFQRIQKERGDLSNVQLRGAA